MQDDRAFIIGSDDRVENRVELLCKDDEEAIRLAKQLVGGHDVELWQEDRLIRIFRVSGAIPRISQP